MRAELSRRGEKLTNIVIQFERAKDGKPYDCPCCSAARTERASANQSGAPSVRFSRIVRQNRLQGAEISRPLP